MKLKRTQIASTHLVFAGGSGDVGAALNRKGKSVPTMPPGVGAMRPAKSSTVHVRGTSRRRRPGDVVVAEALRVLARRLRKPGAALKSPADVHAWLVLNLAERDRESFAAVWLDNGHRVIACEELFRGTLNATTIYPRDVARAAMRHNAAGVILAHNHPSGVAEPSAHDETLTWQLAAVLELVGVRVLDHVIVAGAAAISLADLGRMPGVPVSDEAARRRTARRRKAIRR